ncbi:MAG: hypothetical protein ACI8S3_002462, partial [Alphaproteobacteria bacterium]
MSEGALSPDAGPAVALQGLAHLDDGDIRVGEAALLLALRDRPGVSLDRYQRHLEQLADEVAAAYAQGGPEDTTQHRA